MPFDMLVDKYDLSFIDEIQPTLRFQKVKVKQYVPDNKFEKGESEVLLTFGSCTLSQSSGS